MPGGKLCKSPRPMTVLGVRAPCACGPMHTTIFTDRVAGTTVLLATSAMLPGCIREMTSWDAFPQTCANKSWANKCSTCTCPHRARCLIWATFVASEQGFERVQRGRHNARRRRRMGWGFQRAVAFLPNAVPRFQSGLAVRGQGRPVGPEDCRDAMFWAAPPIQPPVAPFASSAYRLTGAPPQVRIPAAAACGRAVGGDPRKMAHPSVHSQTAALPQRSAADLAMPLLGLQLHP